jgi:protein-S-isoprenylcysteine O-methyltransferase Ste14
MARAAWWKGERGEWYVAGQGALIVLLLFGPPSWKGLPPWPAALAGPAQLAGIVLGCAGLLLLVAGLLRLGPNLTPLPRPREDSTLVVTGIYGLVRHPMYGGVLGLAFGWALWRQGTLTLAYALLALAFLVLKSRREERWLCERYSDYAAYQRRVRRLIPFVY